MPSGTSSPTHVSKDTLWIEGLTNSVDDDVRAAILLMSIKNTSLPVKTIRKMYKHIYER